MHHKKKGYSGEGNGTFARVEPSSPLNAGHGVLSSRHRVLPSFIFLFFLYEFPVNITESLLIHLVLFFMLFFCYSNSGDQEARCLEQRRHPGPFRADCPHRPCPLPPALRYQGVPLNAQPFPRSPGCSPWGRGRAENRRRNHSLRTGTTVFQRNDCTTSPRAQTKRDA